MRASILIRVVVAVCAWAAVACEPSPAPSPPGSPPPPTGVSSGQPTASAAATATASTAAANGPRVIMGKEYAGVILPLDYPWSRGSKRWVADEASVAVAERCIARELPKMKPTPDYQAAKLPLIVKRLKEYRRQYLGYTDAAGVDMLWINFFLDLTGSHSDWKTELVSVRGGGHGYFSVTVDVAGGTCGELRINSPR